MTIFVHGTNSSPKTADPEFIKAVGETFNEDVVQFEWTGENSVQARFGGAEDLWATIKNHDFKEGEELNIIAHSHGGNVVKDTTQIYEKSHSNNEKSIDNLIYLGTPHRKDFILDQGDLSQKAQVINVFDKDDKVQTNLGGGLTGNAKKTINYGTNLEVDSGTGPVDSHLNLDSKPVWQEVDKVLSSKN